MLLFRPFHNLVLKCLHSVKCKWMQFENHRMQFFICWTNKSCTNQLTESERKRKRMWAMSNGHSVIMEIWCRIQAVNHESFVICYLWSANGYIIINKCNYYFACKMCTNNNKEEKQFKCAVIRNQAYGMGWYWVFLCAVLFLLSRCKLEFELPTTVIHMTEHFQRFFHQFLNFDNWIIFSTSFVHFGGNPIDKNS